MSVKSGDNLYINYNDLLPISTLYFHGVSPTAASIKFNQATDDFTMSHDLIVEGSITAEGKIDPVNIDQDGASDTNVLTWETDTSRWQPAAAAGGSSKEYAYFYLTTGGVSAVSSTKTKLIIDTTGISTSDTFSLTSSVVTIHRTATFEIIAECIFNTGGSSRSEYSFNLEQNVGGGDFASQSAIYARGYDSGSTGTFTLQADAVAGDTFTMYIVRAIGSATTGYQDDYGTRIIFKEL